MIRKKEDLYSTYIRNDKGELRELYLKVCSEFGLHKFSGGFDVHFYDTELIQCDEYSMPDSEGILQRSVEIQDDFVELTINDLKVENPLLQTGEDFEHSKTLNFIRDRLVEIHGEPKNLDYMHKLNNAIAFVEGMENKKADYAADAKGEQEKPKRTKVGYEKVELSLIDKIQTIQSGGRLYLNRSGSTWIDESDMKSWTIDALSGREFYSKVDIEITEREAFIEGAMEIAKREGTNNDRAWLGDIFNELISN